MSTLTAVESNAALLYTSGTDLEDISRECNLPVCDLLELFDRDDFQDEVARIERVRIQLRENRALAILDAQMSSKDEKTRAAAAKALLGYKKKTADKPADTGLKVVFGGMQKPGAGA